MYIFLNLLLLIISLPSHDANSKKKNEMKDLWVGKDWNNLVLLLIFNANKVLDFLYLIWLYNSKLWNDNLYVLLF